MIHSTEQAGKKVSLTWRLGFVARSAVDVLEALAAATREEVGVGALALYGRGTQLLAQDVAGAVKRVGRQGVGVVHAEMHRRV